MTMWAQITVTQPEAESPRQALLNLDHVYGIHPSTARCGPNEYPTIEYALIDDVAYREYFDSEKERDAKLDSLKSAIRANMYMVVG